jgi:TM2 domain-containing membrane protein YozV
MGNIYIDNRGGPSGPQGGFFPALLSFFIPGLGQLLLGRVGRAIGHFFVAVLLWFILLGWLVHLYSAYEASR